MNRTHGPGCMKPRVTQGRSEWQSHCKHCHCSQEGRGPPHPTTDITVPAFVDHHLRYLPQDRQSGEVGYYPYERIPDSHLQVQHLIIRQLEFNKGLQASPGTCKVGTFLFLLQGLTSQRKRLFLTAPGTVRLLAPRGLLKPYVKSTAWEGPSHRLVRRALH